MGAGRTGRTSSFTAVSAGFEEFTNLLDRAPPTTLPHIPAFGTYIQLHARNGRFLNACRSARTLMDYLQPMKKQNYRSMTGTEVARVRAVATPLAVYEALLDKGIIQEVISISEYKRWEALTSRRLEIGLMYMMQLVSGCRVSELLALKWSDLYMGVGFMVQGKKGSNSRLVVVSGYSGLFSKMREQRCDVFQGLSYGIIYRYYIRHGVVKKMRQNVRRTVTHSGRYDFVERLMKMGCTDEQIKDVIGHKSIKSTMKYIGKIK